METFPLVLALIGLIGLSVSWMPALCRKISFSYSILYLGLGLLLYYLIPQLLPWPNPFREQTFTIHMTELMVIIALMSTGLRIDRKLTFISWRAPFMLIVILMPLSIVSLAFLGYAYLGWSLASALLIGAVMAPTDPVLASDVQVGPPGSQEDHPVKFALTAEAGMNDGLAFPFTFLAIAVATTAASGEPWFWQWFTFDLLYKVSAGIVSGVLLGWIISIIFFSLPKRMDMIHVRDGLVALSGTLAVYGLTELISGYGFIAVFVAAVTMRNYEKDHEYNEKLHEFIDQTERLFLGVLLLLFGGSLYFGILNPLTWEMAITGLLFVFVIRPIGGVLSLWGLALSVRERLAIGFFGIKGIGSFYYLSYALGEAEFSNAQELWALSSFIVLVSIIVHGLSAIPVMTSKSFRHN